MYGSTKVTQMHPVHAVNLVANSGNTAYGVDVIRPSTGGGGNAKRLTSIQVSTTAIWRPTLRERITVPSNRMNSVRNQFQPRKGVIWIDTVFQLEK